jgi:hypothetical protein
MVDKFEGGEGGVTRRNKGGGGGLAKIDSIVFVLDKQVSNKKSLAHRYFALGHL